VAVAAIGPVVGGSSPAGRALVTGRTARLEAPGRSFHIDGSSSKWICVGERACQPQATLALAAGRRTRARHRLVYWTCGGNRAMRQDGKGAALPIGEPNRTRPDCVVELAQP
jgi:hypothetical protein